MSTDAEIKDKFIEWIKGMPMDEACKILGKWPSTLKRWIKRERNPDYESIIKYHEIQRGNAENPPVQSGQPVNEDVQKADGKIEIPAEGFSESQLLEICDQLVAKRDQVPFGVIERLRDVLFPWEGKNLSVLFPCYKHTNAATAWSMIAIAMDLGKDKVFFDMEIGDAMIINARNKLATRFVNSGREWSLWIDDDMILPIGRAPWFKDINRCPELSDHVAGQHVVHRLVSHRKTIVGGTYFGRFKHAPPMFNGMTDKTQTKQALDMKDALLPTDWVGTGCLLVHRNVYLDIQKKFPELAPVHDRAEWDFFRRFTDGNGKGGEDVAFCRRAREAGHQVFIDTGLQCGHVGYHVYGAWTNQRIHGYNM